MKRQVIHVGSGRPCLGNPFWSTGRGESQGSGWTQGLDNSFVLMALPVHPAHVFLAHGRKGVGMQKQLKIGVSLPIPPRRASVCLPVGLLRDLEEGSRSSLLPMVSGSAFVCLTALQGQEEAAGLGNNGSFSGSLRLPRSDRGHGTVARRHNLLAPLLQEFSPQEMMGSTAGMQGDLPQPTPLPQVPVPGWSRDEGLTHSGCAL